MHDRLGIRLRDPADLTEQAAAPHVGDGPVVFGANGAWLAALGRGSLQILAVPSLVRRSIELISSGEALAADPKGNIAVVVDGGATEETAMGAITARKPATLVVFEVESGKRVTIAFTSGFAVMGSEVASGRLLAPSFGTSSLVWSSLIGAVLGALAAGAMVGGQWTKRPHALRETFAATAIAGVLLAFVPVFSRPLMRATLEHFLAGRLVVLGLGFAAVLAMIVVPVILLGAIGPVLVHYAIDERADVGRRSGHLSALGTLGSLAGTFACGLVLVPYAGTEATFRICGSIALLVGAFGWSLAGRASRRGAVVLAAAGGLVVIGSAMVPDLARTGRPPVFEAETARGHVKVVDDARHRTLYLDDGYAKQSVVRLDGEAYLRGVWGYYALAPTFTKRTPSRILVIGLGGGTSATEYRRRIPTAEIVAVEIDAGVIAVAQRFFGLPSSVEVHCEDARAFLARDRRSFDLVVVDAFQFPYVPFQLATREFFEDVRGQLNEGGVLVVNAGRNRADLDVVRFDQYGDSATINPIIGA